MIPQVISPQITELQNKDARLQIRDKALEKGIKELNAIKSQGSKENIDDRESRIAMVLAGNDVPSENDIDAKLKTAWLNRQTIHEARQALKAKIAAAKYETGTAILKSPEVQKSHGEIMQRLVGPLVEVATAWTDLFAMSRELRDREVGFRFGICETMPLDLLGAPNVYSPLAQFLQAAVAAGYIKAGAIPKELRSS